ncbi:hypothetical protein SAMN05660964_03073 [Thiothrix caldifontis]|uniref:Uncharacterized protein n=1 Tax=Thiothrix caldifontis TaxID=525918 RepID=A0A1H4FRW0_9GAMM|nr:hypothetical protein [Thiothrix caldifontis]SEA99408.1 hypothetical protein SAMN05660964_03073 [Thiothrix caldifontis]
MKKLLIGLSLLALSATASANDFFGGNDGEWKMGPYGPYYEESDWPEWTPMYWMDEMMNSFDDEDSYGDNGFMGGMPFMGNNNMPFMGGNNYPMMPYGAAPMGAPMMAPPMGAPMMAPPMGAPMMAPPMGAPMMAPPAMPAPGAAPGPAAN